MILDFQIVENIRGNLRRKIQSNEFALINFNIKKYCERHQKLVMLCVAMRKKYPKKNLFWEV